MMQDEQLVKIKEFIKEKHRGQVDKSGFLYTGHLFRVANKAGWHNRTLYMIGLLHDVVEDTDATVEDVRALAGDRVALAVDAMTRREGEPYFDYIKRLKANEDAVEVKKYDLVDNMNLSRIPEPTNKDLDRVKKYADAYKILIDK